MVTAETLSLAAILIAPGVISVLIAVTLGVVERDIGRDRFYLTSFVSSIFIDVVFIWIAQIWWGRTVTGRAELESVFFGANRFHVGAAVLLFTISCVFGLIYSVVLTYNISHFCRQKIGFLRSHRRNPWQPWEGGLRNAEQVMVQRHEGSDVVGMLSEYSRVEKERQIVLNSPQFLEFEDESNREKVIISGDEISIVHVLTTKDREGFWSQFS